jgi:proline dehydrogenase
LILRIINRPFVRRVATGGLGRKVALRFVAGEDIEHAIDAIRAINAEGASASADYLGENVSDLEQAKAAAGAYLATLDRIAAEGLSANISVKLTQLGLDIDSSHMFTLVEEIVARAAQIGTSVTLDMEDHRYTERTVEAAVRLARAFPGAVGVAVQAYLHRTPADLERLIEAGAGVRLCKGAYSERHEIAYRKKAEVDAAFARLANRLLTSKSYAMVATHDERLVQHVIKQLEKIGRAPGTYEFQMLYGVRRELQRRLDAQGYRLRVYVPFGSEWYPYLMRRIAERPANVRFFVEALARG